MFTSPLPHDAAAETASFRKAFASAMQKARPACSPPAEKTESAEGLAAPVESEQAGDTCHRALVSVFFRCPYFGTNSAVVRLSEWPRFQRSIGKRRILSAYVVGSLV